MALQCELSPLELLGSVDVAAARRTDRPRAAWTPWRHLYGAAFVDDLGRGPDVPLPVIAIGDIAHIRIS